MKLIREVIKYRDCKNNVRVNTVIRLRIGEAQSINGDHEYVSKSEYRKWLRFALKNANSKIGNIPQEIRHYDYEDELTSFYRIKHAYLWGWFVHLIVPIDSNRCTVITRYCSTLVDAFDLMTHYKINDDFAIHSLNDTYEIYPLTDESMIIACLKYSDI